MSSPLGHTAPPFSLLPSPPPPPPPPHTHTQRTVWEGMVSLSFSSLADTVPVLKPDIWQGSFYSASSLGWGIEFKHKMVALCRTSYSHIAWEA